MSYERKAPKVRVHYSLDDYLRDLSKRTGLSKVKCSKFLADTLKERDLKILKKPRTRMFKFDFKM
ncbi:hypothetical protein ES702_04941 [subsurface metagenome]